LRADSLRYSFGADQDISIEIPEIIVGEKPHSAILPRLVVKL
jgi:hypothetical protein